MASRYCFTTSNSNWKDIVENVYDNLGANFEKLSTDDICVSVNNRQMEKQLIKRNSILGMNEGFSRPIFVPKWSTIINNGPFVIEDNIIQSNLFVTLKSTGKQVPLSFIGERALNCYESTNKSKTYQKNFKESFMSFTGIDVSDIDLYELNTLQPDPIPNKKKYGYVIIDGVRVPLMTFVTPSTKIDSNGYIIPGIFKSDVILNASEPVNGFRTEFVPGASWVAKWTTQYLTGRIYLDFNNIDDDESAEPDESADESADSTTNRPAVHKVTFNIDGSPQSTDVSIESDDIVSQYAGSEDLENFENNSFESEDDIEDEDDSESHVTAYKKGFHHGPLLRVPYDKEETIDEWSKPDFINLADYEKQYLPLSYVISQVAQWRILLNSLRSNFNNITELPKINDFTLELITDAISYAMSNEIEQLPSAIALLEYANKRKTLTY